MNGASRHSAARTILCKGADARQPTCPTSRATWTIFSSHCVTNTAAKGSDNGLLARFGRGSHVPDGRRPGVRSPVRSCAELWRGRLALGGRRRGVDAEREPKRRIHHVVSRSVVSLGSYLQHLKVVIDRVDEVVGVANPGAEHAIILHWNEDQGAQTQP